MDRADALALLDVMRMQIVHAPPRIDEARLISAYLAAAPTLGLNRIRGSGAGRLLAHSPRWRVTCRPSGVTHAQAARSRVGIATDPPRRSGNIPRTHG